MQVEYAGHHWNFHLSSSYVAVINVTMRPVTSHIYWSQVYQHSCDLGIFITMRSLSSEFWYNVVSKWKSIWYSNSRKQMWDSWGSAGSNTFEAVAPSAASFFGSVIIHPTVDRKSCSTFPHKGSVSFLVAKSWRFLSRIPEQGFFCVTTFPEFQDGVSGMKLWRPEV